MECIKLQEETIATLRQRETEAIDKVKQAVSLAEEGQRLTSKVCKVAPVRKLRESFVFERVSALQPWLAKRKVEEDEQRD